MSVPRPRTLNPPPNWPVGYPSVVNKDKRHIQQDSFTLHRGHYGVVIETKDFDDGTTIVKNLDPGTTHGVQWSPSCPRSSSSAAAASSSAATTTTSSSSSSSSAAAAPLPVPSQFSGPTASLAPKKSTKSTKKSIGNGSGQLRVDEMFARAHA
ncbi:hypothetical protein DIS24_g1558 [Lasiodiplodia hormozganensis]|uniref:Uncharacterized protein n=1 Tax=Lasiodiplodia hormozganensis TaxID=869390 RepID=A0AA39Z255_9PEZI|nr:hypothetical protein DIS24_g1558 [Lasiodiplodia hormozganensis]